METITLETLAGYHIDSACKNAVAMANEKNSIVEFDFNGTKVVVRPGDDPSAASRKWGDESAAQHEAYIASPEYKEIVRKRQEESDRKDAATLTESAQSEADMRVAENPWPRNERQLTEYIASIVDRQHDYGTCVYAMSLAAIAAFNYVAGRLGVTGFQSSCADMDIIRRTRRIEGPFMLVDVSKALYPQCAPVNKVSEFMQSDDVRKWLREEAAKKLLENPGANAEVIEHWNRMAANAA